MEYWFCLTGFALMLGSLVTMLHYRLPIMLGLRPQKHPKFKVFNLFLPRSHCPHCAHIIPFYHNIPILSYGLNRGSCAYCKHPIPKTYIFIEVFYSVSLLGFAYFNPDGWKIAAAAWFITLVTLQIVIDLDFMLLPDEINYVLLWSGLFINRFNLFCSLDEAVYGAGIGYLSLWGFYHIYAKLTGKHGFGYGDFKLFAALGAWIGIFKLIPCMLFSACIGIVYGCIVLSKQQGPMLKTPIPFGPALGISGLILLSFNPGLGF